MAVPTFEKLASQYRKQWSGMWIVPDYTDEIDAIARKLVSYKPRYVAVEQSLGVPWYFVAVLHNRESSARFDRHLHNGDALTGRTHRVPAGRPLTGDPPFTWAESAADALTMKGLHKIKSWPVERLAYEGERYNGWGYHNRGVPSAYLWSFSDVYTGGKYVADHVWDANAKDKQAGIMPILKRMAELDPSIKLKTGSAVSPEVGAGGAVVAVGTGAAVEAARQGMSPAAIFAIVVVAVAAAVAVFVVLRNRKRQKGAL